MRYPNHHKILVQQFHTAFKHTETPAHPRIQTIAVRELRAKLILEEALEFIAACGCVVRVDGIELGANFVNIHVQARDFPNLVEMADGLGDLDYVVQGTNLVFGLPSEEIFKEIHASNMSKLDADGSPIIREDGKILKGPNYFKPKIAEILARCEKREDNFIGNEFHPNPQIPNIKY